MIKVLLIILVFLSYSCDDSLGLDDDVKEVIIGNGKNNEIRGIPYEIMDLEVIEYQRYVTMRHDTIYYYWNENINIDSMDIVIDTVADKTILSLNYLKISNKLSLKELSYLDRKSLISPVELSLEDIELKDTLWITRNIDYKSKYQYFIFDDLKENIESRNEAIYTENNTNLYIGFYHDIANETIRFKLYSKFMRYTWYMKMKCSFVLSYAIE